jgi:hypothetical protein
MMNPVLRKIFGPGRNQQPPDLATFNDPLALETQWTPATKGGTNFRTHRLMPMDTSRVEFRASFGARFFYSAFLVVGLAVGMGFLYWEGVPPTFTFDQWFPLLFSAVFILIGVVLLYTGLTPIVFDKAIGYFWKGRTSPQDQPDIAALKTCARLDQIHAIQLVAEWVRARKTSYFSYEINLVLEDARRITVIDQGNLHWIREDAKTLSEFLGKPLWDATVRSESVGSRP